VTDEEGRTLTTSAELSHRQADATWRLLRGELILPMSRVDAYSTRLETELYNRKLVYTQEKGLEVQELDRM